VEEELYISIVKQGVYPEVILIVYCVPAGIEEATAQEKL
jgi:hypothetical protein